VFGVTCSFQVALSRGITVRVDAALTGLHHQAWEVT
jgi:hypothetical protein